MAVAFVKTCTRGAIMYKTSQGSHQRKEKIFSKEVKQVFWEQCYGEVYAPARVISTFCWHLIFISITTLSIILIIYGDLLMFLVSIGAGFISTSWISKWRQNKRLECVFQADEMFKRYFPSEKLEDLKRHPVESSGFPIA